MLSKLLLDCSGASQGDGVESGEPEVASGALLGALQACTRCDGKDCLLTFNYFKKWTPAPADLWEGVGGSGTEPTLYST